MTETIIVTLRDRSEIDHAELVERGRQLVLSRKHAPPPAGDDGPSTTRRASQQVSSCKSRQVSWWAVHVYVDRLLARSDRGELPWPGTPAWCALPDDDPRKLLALATFAEHHALRVETAQQALAEASKAVAAAADWRAIASEITLLHAARQAGARIERIA